MALTTLPGDWFERWVGRGCLARDGASNRVSPSAFRRKQRHGGGFAWYCFDGRPINSDESRSSGMRARPSRAAARSQPGVLFGDRQTSSMAAVDVAIPHGGPAVQHWVLRGSTAHESVLTGLTALNVYRFTQRVYGETRRV